MLADAKQYLKRKNIDQSDDAFVQIKDMLTDKNMKFCYMFTYFHYESQLPMATIREIWNKIDTMKDHIEKMPKDIITYRNPVMLMNELIELEKVVIYDRFSKFLPEALDKSYKEIFKQSDRIGLKRQADFEKRLTEFFSMNEEYQKDFVKNVSRIKTGTQLLIELKAFVKYVKAGRDIESIKKTDVPGLKKLFVDQNIVLCEVLNHKTMRSVGSTSWCISRDSAHWKSYVTDVSGAKQHIMWNNQVPMTSVDHLIAFTCSGNGKSLNEIVRNAHDRRNTSIVLQDYINKYSLQRLLPFIGVKNDFDRIIEVLDNLHNESMKRNVTPAPSGEANNLRSVDFSKKELIIQLMSSKTLEFISNYPNGAVLELINDSSTTKNSIVLYFVSIQLFNDRRFWECFLRNFNPTKELTAIEGSLTVQVFKAVLKQDLQIDGQRLLYNAMIKKTFASMNSTFWLQVLPEVMKFVEKNEKLDNMLARELRNIYHKIHPNSMNTPSRLAVAKLLKMLKIEEKVVEHRSMSSFDSFFSMYDTRTSTLQQTQNVQPIAQPLHAGAGPAAILGIDNDAEAWMQQQWAGISPNGGIPRREEMERHRHDNEEIEHDFDENEEERLDDSMNHYEGEDFDENRDYDSMNNYEDEEGDDGDEGEDFDENHDYDA